MTKIKIKKSFIYFFIFVQLALLPVVSFADILGIQGSNPLTPMFVTNTVNPAVDGPILIDIEASSKVNQGCAAAEQAFAAGDTTAQFAFSGLSLIGGSPLLTGQLQAKIVKLEGFIACRQGVLTNLETIITPDLITAQPKQTLSNAATIAITSLKAKEDNIKAQLANATQGFWKTLVFNILIKTSKTVAQSLVTKLVNNFKIQNTKQYADSLATLMYDNQYLRDNFPNAQGQLMARAILENPLVRKEVQPGIFIAADSALGYNPKALDPNDPDFYTKMAMAGGGSANPYFQNTLYVSSVDQAHASAQASANLLIGQGNGYKAPVNCASSLAQQRSIDAQSKGLQDQLNNRKALLQSFEDAKTNGQKVPEADMAKAQHDYDVAFTNWNNLPYAVTGTSSVSSASSVGGSNKEGTAAIVMCEAISSPAQLVSQGIDKAFTAVGVNMAQYNNNNLPGFMSIIGDVASQIGSSLVFGGTTAAKNAALANESKVVTSGVAAATQAAASNASANLAKGIIFEEPESSGVTNGYTLDWQVVTETLKTASFVTISGNGIPTTGAPQRLPLTGTKNIVITPVPDSSHPGSFLTSYPYILTVYDASGKLLTQSSATVTLQSATQAFNYNSNAPKVAGAFTSHTVIDPRGSALSFSPR